jgi:hypothetical protein
MLYNNIGDKMIREDKAIMIAEKLGIEFNKFSLEDFVTGLNIELEHGLKNPKTNVTSDDLEMTAKIALAHLNEFSDYYNDEYGLPAFERLLKSKNEQ